VGSWQDPDLGRPIVAPLERCAELLGIDLATVRELAAELEPYVRADGTRIWSLMQLERQLRPEAYGRRRGGYVDRRSDLAPTHSWSGAPRRLLVMSRLSTVSVRALRSKGWGLTRHEPFPTGRRPGPS
jgi:hypothetical protein